MIVIVDWIGFVFNALGAWYVGHYRRRIGFLYFIVGSSAYALLGWQNGNMGLVSTSVMFVLMDIYFYYRWGKVDEK